MGNWENVKNSGRFAAILRDDLRREGVEMEDSPRIAMKDGGRVVLYAVEGLDGNIYVHQYPSPVGGGWIWLTSDYYAPYAREIREAWGEK